MIIRIRFGRWRMTWSLAPVTDVVGVHSNLEDGNHILMWDFDDTTLNKVIRNLLPVQRTYKLPDIRILETKKAKNFIVYCFKRTPWRKAIEIIAYTKGVDYNFLKYGIYRDKFTLRVTPKAGRKPKLICTMKSLVKEDVKISELQRWVRYETVDHDNAPKLKCRGCDSIWKHCLNIGGK